MDKIKVILFAMTGFGNNAFKILKRQPFIELIGVVTPKRKETPFPYYKCRQIQDEAIDSGIALYEGLILKETKACELLRALSPDLIVVSTFRQIIPEDIISIPKLGIINIHPSLLPRYRGPTPTHWVLANREKQTGVTVHFIEDERIDSGRIIAQRRLDILSSDTEDILRKKLAVLSEKALVDALPLVMKEDRKTFVAQDEAEATYFPKPTVQGSRL